MIVRHWIASGGMTIALLACPANGSAYDVRTHGELTRAAFEGSQRVADYLTAVGLKSTCRQAKDRLHRFALRR